MRILLLSAYDTLSHQRWRKGLVTQLDEHQWTVLTLPPRWFAWRIRGNSLSWGLGHRATLEAGYDLVVATSMTDLASLRGLVPTLATIPSLVYFHENQFSYPVGEHQTHPTIEAQLVPLYAALAADRVVFNSAYNRDRFLQGCDQLLGKMPDAVPAGISQHIAARSEVLPVPLTDAWYQATPQRDPSAPLNILWNHRWEYDKAPERFFAALRLLQQQGGDFQLQVLGQRFRNSPPIFAQSRPDLERHIEHWGTLDSDEDYRQALARADVVVSTSLHEFQGLAILEAVAAGCLPLVPDRLAYRETIPECFRYPSHPGNPEVESRLVCERLARLARTKHRAELPSAPDMEQFSWRQRAADYRAVITATGNDGR